MTVKVSVKISVELRDSVIKYPSQNPGAPEGKSRATRQGSLRYGGTRAAGSSRASGALLRRFCGAVPLLWRLTQSCPLEQEPSEPARSSLYAAEFEKSHCPAPRTRPPSHGKYNGDPTGTILGVQ